MKNLRKVQFGLLAVLLAVGIVFGMSAFKKDPISKRLQYTFRYNGPDYLQANVETESNWVYSADPITCDGEPEEACSILVDESFVNNPMTTPTLKSSLNIISDVYLSTAFVKKSDDETMEIVNRTQQ